MSNTEEYLKENVKVILQPMIKDIVTNKPKNKVIQNI